MSENKVIENQQRMVIACFILLSDFFFKTEKNTKYLSPQTPAVQTETRTEDFQNTTEDSNLWAMIFLARLKGTDESPESYIQSLEMDLGLM
jgi:hypothetical protein